MDADGKVWFASSRNFIRIGVVLVLLALPAVWHFPPLQQWLSVEHLPELIASIRNADISIVWVLLGLIVASLLMVPLSLLVAMSGFMFGPWLGFAYALLIGVVSGLLGFYLGVFLGRDTVERFATGRIHQLNIKLSEHGVMATIGLRVVPFAPFAVQNIMAGASRITRRDFIVGNAIGLLPAITFTIVVTQQISSFLQAPDIFSLITLVIVVALGALFLVGLKRWFNKRNQS